MFENLSKSERLNQEYLSRSQQQVEQQTLAEDAAPLPTVEKSGRLARLLTVLTRPGKKQEPEKPVWTTGSKLPQFSVK